MAWAGGFSGVGFTRDEFRAWLRSQPKPPYVRIVNHMTDAPYTKAPVPCTQRIRNLGSYYRNDLGWSGGPDFFSLGDDKIYLGTPMGKSIGCSGWNGNSFHIEVEGKYNGKTHDYKTGRGLENWKVSAWAQAELLEWMGWKADGDRIKLHKEGKTGHDCPGVVPKDWIIEQIKAAQGVLPDISPETPKPAYHDVLRKGDKHGDVPLLQTTLSNMGYYKGKIDGDFGPLTDAAVKNYQKSIGLKVDGIVGPITWGRIDAMASQKPQDGPKPPPVSDTKEPPKPAPEPPMGSEQKEYAPGKAKWSEDWCLKMMKKVEGLRLAAYVDKPGWAIGYGHNSTSGVPPTPTEDMTLEDEKEAEAILRADLDECARYINAWVKVPLTQGNVDALCMFTFQQGPTQFRSYLIPTINAGDHAKVAELIETKEHANPGVMRRRRLEASRYRGETPFKW